MRIGDGIAALILAGGYSTRAPDFKPLLPLGDTTVIANAINAFDRVGICDITVVAGYRAAELAPALAHLPVRSVFNENYGEGMFSSVLAGVRTLRPQTDAFFLLPADMPLVRSRTIKLLYLTYKRTGADVIYPVFQGLRGHPPLISSHLLPAILSWNGHAGLRGLLAQYEAKATEVEVFDEGIVMDIDTPQDYRRIFAGCRRDIPSWNECNAILTKLAVPDIVVRHSKMVSNVAQRLAERLNQASLKLDDGLVRAGGMLHDLAKGQPDHARLGARIVKRLGYPKVAKIVASHTDLVFAGDMSIDEAAVVYLADKLVKCDRMVSISERFAFSLEKYAGDAHALTAARQRLLNTQSMAKAIENIIGASLATVISSTAMDHGCAEREIIDENAN